jgi:hypothetical protein
MALLQGLTAGPAWGAGVGVCSFVDQLVAFDGFGAKVFRLSHGIPRHVKRRIRRSAPTDYLLDRLLDAFA